MKPTTKLLYVLTLLALLLLPVSSAHAKGLLPEGRVVVGDSFTLKSGEMLDGDLVVIGGAATIEKDAVVKGSLVVIGGSLTLDGEVDGDSLVIGGLATLGATSLIKGDLATLGGSVARAEGALVEGQVVTNIPSPNIQIPHPPSAPNPPNPPQPPKVEVNFNPFWEAAGVLFRAVAIAALAMLVIIFLQPQIERVAQTIVRQPLVSGGVGLLTVVLAPVVLVLLVLTLILIPVAALAGFLLVLAWLFGVIALGMEVGERFTQAIHQTWAPVLTAGFGTFLLVLVIEAIGMVVPCVGWLAPFLAGLVAIGGVALTFFGSRPYPRPGAMPPASPADPSAGSGQAIPPAS